LFIILQQNVNTVKVERDVGVAGKEGCTDVGTDEVYAPSQMSICKTEYEVSIMLRCLVMVIDVHICACVCVTVCCIGVSV
jgi:hypothetical protein